MRSLFNGQAVGVLTFALGVALSASLGGGRQAHTPEKITAVAPAPRHGECEVHGLTVRVERVPFVPTRPVAFAEGRRAVGRKLFPNSDRFYPHGCVIDTTDGRAYVCDACRAAEAEWEREALRTCRQHYGPDCPDL